MAADRSMFIMLLLMSSMTDMCNTDSVFFNFYATEGDTVHFLCNTTVRAPVFWKYHRNTEDLPSYICMGTPNVLPKYQQQFQLDNTTYTLTIYNVTVNESGLYSCVDDWGYGETYATWLTVEVKNLTEATTTKAKDDTSMATSHVILVAVVVPVIVLVVAAIIVFFFVKRFKEMKSHPHELEFHEIIPLRASPSDELVPANEQQLFTIETDPFANELAREIRRLSHQLKGMIEPDYGLLDQLISLDVFTRREYSEIRQELTDYKRLDRLLNLLTTEKTEEQCRDFLLALQRTDQQHVVNYIQQHGDTNERFGDVRPLDNDQLQHLVVNTPALVKLVDSNNSFMIDMASSGCITQEHETILRAIQFNPERNRKLLEILQRRSVAHLKKFAECLTNNNQKRLSETVLQPGVLLEVNAKLDERSIDDVSEAENQIVTRFTQIMSRGDNEAKQRLLSVFADLYQTFLSDCDIETRPKLLSLLEELQEKTRSLGEDVDLVALRKQHSIGCYFSCQTREALEHLHHLYVNRELCKTLDLLFILLRRGTERTCTKGLHLIQEDYQCCLNYLKTRGSSTFVGDTINKFKLPMEVLEMLLMKMFIVIFLRRLRTDGRVSEVAERLAYIALSSVCCDWWQTLNGWPQSHTKHWVRHRLQRSVIHVCRPFRFIPQLVNQLDTKSGLRGVTQLDDKIFIVCSLSDTIEVFGLNNDLLEGVKVKGLKDPQDIVACNETRSLYVADWLSYGYVWRASTDGRVISKFLPTTTTTTAFRPRSLSATSGRLLVTTADDELLLYGADGVELKRLSFTDMYDIRHSVETSRGTFVFCHIKPQPQVVEVDGDGRTLSAYSDQQKVDYPRYLSFDFGGKV